MAGALRQAQEGVGVALQRPSAPLFIVVVQFVALDQLDELTGVAGVGSIACLAQPSCPAFVVGALELKQRAVARAARQKVGVLLVRVVAVAKNAVTTAFVLGGLAAPTTATLDPKVIVGFFGKGTAAIARF